MSVSAERLSQILEQQGIDQKPEDQIENDLNKLANANWFERKVIAHRTGMDGDEAKRTGANAQRLTNESFGGSEHKAIAFLKNLEGTDIGKMDVNELCESGAASKLANLSPKDLEKVKAGHYKNVTELNEKLDKDYPQQGPSNASQMAKDEQSTPATPTENKQSETSVANTATNTTLENTQNQLEILQQIKEVMNNLFKGTALVGLGNGFTPMLHEVMNALALSPDKAVENFGADGKPRLSGQNFANDTTEFRNSNTPSFSSGPSTFMPGPGGMV